MARMIDIHKNLIAVMVHTNLDINFWSEAVYGCIDAPQQIPAGSTWSVSGDDEILIATRSVLRD